jgi:acetyltransferase-like isoleucine patch superfamily enzyme
VSRRLRALLNLLVGQWPIYRRWLHRRKHPGLLIADSADLCIEGTLGYGEQARIGERSILNVSAGGRIELGRDVYIGRGVELGTHSLIEVGDFASVQDYGVVLGNVSIGRYCTIAYRFYASSGKHYFEHHPGWLIRDQDQAVRDTPELARQHDRQVVVEDDCWIGANVVLMQGVRVGKGSVVGANAVVTESIPPYCVAVGSPARVIRKRLDFSPPARIEARESDHIPYFYSGFSVRRADLARTAQLGGIAAGAHFSVCLRAAATLHLRMRALVADPVFLCHGGQRVRLDATLQTVTFAIAGPAPWLFAADSTAAARELVAVESAWVED